MKKGTTFNVNIPDSRFRIEFSKVNDGDGWRGKIVNMKTRKPTAISKILSTKEVSKICSAILD